MSLEPTAGAVAAPDPSPKSTSQVVGPPAPPTKLRTLDRSLLVGVAWTAGMKWATQILSWASTLLVARLLTPADYGLFGMAMVYAGFVAPIYDLGLGAAIVQRHGVGEDRDAVARLGGLSIVYGAVFSLLSILLARPLARFYGEPQVAWIVTMLALAFFVTSFQMLPRAVLSRDLAFRTLALIDGVAALSLTVGTLALAIAGWRYRALVYGQMLSAVVTTIAALVWARHRIALPRGLRALRTAVAFGWQVSASKIAWYVYTNADFAVVGRVLGKVALGGYTFGWTIATIPVDRVSQLVTRVMPSVLAAVRDDREALRRYFLSISEGLAVVALPLSIGLALTADHFVLLALGDRWRPAIVPLALLGVYSGYRSLATLLSPVLVATGQAKSNMHFTIIAAIVLPVMFYVGARSGGTAGVALAWIVGFPLVSTPMYLRTMRTLGVRAGDYVRALWPALSGTLVMAAAVVAARLLAAPLPLAARFAVEVSAGIVAYAAVMWTLHRARLLAFRSLLRELRR
ncbi:MAG: lipopolysaccharide biosynthesis protein [Gemmatimonadaceae bacterium]|nr:lipopolysaccharide biosynthesis protein [Gemmatimonadaceae bacterium]NUQ92164.1 lipopolysaccharide biosynthesis protein [Gemmatimonadaceae bacterium]NUR20945.1 lipopolysaccharide biosynthesis protein [Gemmatimonadaceae bacterium]NUS97084.1 lipopolysaccharide biosynthesis protein [Gemmatimonadaceae bacterium]